MNNINDNNNKISQIQKKHFPNKIALLNGSNSIYYNCKSQSNSIINTTQLYNNYNNHSINRIAKTPLHKHLLSSDLIYINNSNNFNSSKECILVKDELIPLSKPIQTQTTEHSTFSIIDKPFTNNNFHYKRTHSLKEKKIKTNINNIYEHSLTNIVTILINSEILPLNLKLTLSMLNKNIYIKNNPLNILSNHIAFLNKNIISLKHSLSYLIFIPSYTAQINLQFLTYDEENIIYNCSSIMKAICYCICCYDNNGDNSLSLLKDDDIVKKIYEITNQRRLSNVLLNKDTLNNITKMDCFKCKGFIDIIETIYNNNQYENIIKMAVYNKIMFYINEVYLFIKKRYESITKITTLNESLRKYQKIETMNKLNQ
jgi:hypothetical protein